MSRSKHVKRPARRSRSKRNVNLTVKQGRVLEAIKVLSSRLGHSPTFAELADEVGLPSENRGAISGHLAALKKRGLVTWGSRVPRSLTVLHRHKKGQMPSANEVKGLLPPAPIESTDAGGSVGVIQMLRFEEAKTAQRLEALRQAIKLLEESTIVSGTPSLPPPS